MSSLILQSRRIASVFIVCASFATAFRAQQPKVLAPHHPVAPRLPRHREWDKPAVPQSLTGGLWMIDGNTKATAYLTNMLKYDPVTVTPILHLGNGKAYPLAPVKLEPSGTATIDINQALASQAAASTTCARRPAVPTTARPAMALCRCSSRTTPSRWPWEEASRRRSAMNTIPAPSTM